jgi:hypothetical protein
METLQVKKTAVLRGSRALLFSQKQHHNVAMILIDIVLEHQIMQDKPLCAISLHASLSAIICATPSTSKNTKLTDFIYRNTMLYVHHSNVN